MNNKKFQPDFSYLLDVLHNRRPKRLPLYEHHIDTPFIEKVCGREIALQGSKPADYEAYYTELISFWASMTYDGFDYEAAICDILPGHGAIMGGFPGPIQTRKDFEAYPFEDIPKIFWEVYTPDLEAIRNVLPPGMKAYGGCGYGIFETSEDLVGYEFLCTLPYTDPDLFRDLYIKIGDLYMKLWSEMIHRYGDLFAFFRIGDDMGFKTGMLLPPDIIREHILPQYKRVIQLIHSYGKKFLLHNCGKIFDIMDDFIRIGIDAKHSNEDQIAPFEIWIEKYNDRIGLFGGIDVNTLCLNSYEDVYTTVLEKGLKYRSMARGWGLGSGNSIPEFVPVDGFMGMIDAAKEIRRHEK